MADLGSLIVNLDANTKGLQDGLSETKSMMSGFKKSFLIGTAAVAGLTTAAVGFAKKASDATDRIDKMSQKTGISRKAFQEWDFILSQTGTDIAILQTGVKTLSRAADEAAQGTESYSDAFNRLGVSVKDANGEMKSQEDLLFDTITALSQMENQTERSAVASELLGKSATELAPLLNAGAGSIEEMKQQASDLGLVLGDDVIDAGVKMTDTMDQIKRSLGAVGTEVGGALLPMFQTMLDWVVMNIPAIRETIGNVFNYISPLIMSIVDFVKNNLPIIQRIGKTAFDVIKVAIGAVGTVLESVVLPAFELLFKWWDENGETIKTGMSSAFETIKKAIDAVVDAIKAVIDWFEQAIEKAKEFFSAQGAGNIFGGESTSGGIAGVNNVSVPSGGGTSNNVTNNINITTSSPAETARELERVNQEQALKFALGVY